MNYIDNLNYLNDPRTRGPAEEPLLYLYDEVTDEETVVQLPTRWEVCDACEGEGTHVNPAIDCGGVKEEWADDPEFRHDYLAGKYDVVCGCCGGNRVVKNVDWDALNDEHRAAYEEQLQGEYDTRQEHLAELRMGA